MTLLELDMINTGAVSSALTASAAGAESDTATCASTLHSAAHRAFGALLLAGGLGFPVAGPSITQPVLMESAAAATWSVLHTPPFERGVNAGKHAKLLSIMGSWSGDDFEACLDLVYQTRSMIGPNDVSA